MSPDNPLFKLKQYLKDSAIGIRNLKATMKSVMREKGGCAGSIQHALISTRSDFRCHHIAYCELRGLERSAIEIPADTNLPNETLIAKIKSQYGLLFRDWLRKKHDERIQRGNSLKIASKSGATSI